MTKDENGITTGSVATAASLAALLRIKNQDTHIVTITTPKETINVEVEHTTKLAPNKATATVKKPTYNDPDVTRGIEIIAEVTLTDKPKEIEIIGGKGVGTVTKSGLQIPVGQAAINPVPRQMITKNIKDNLLPNQGAIVKIIVPLGEKLAPKTMNKRLGIINGISILGTTGIARPMSSKAYMNSLKYQITVAIAGNYKDLIFVPGNIGNKIAKQLIDINEDQLIEMSNFVGFMIEEADKTGQIDNILILGHAGKLIKIAAGITNTKQSVADARREIMAAYTAINGADTKTIQDIFNSNTTEDMIKILDEKQLTNKVFESIADHIIELCNLKYDINFSVIIVKMNGEILTPEHAKNTPFKLK
ncbi:MAG: cobalt-precorrin-5B (C(1))-methyltransferase CbiD [Methanobacteriaceae archaeon]|nr:cobalt-precorrin-5B (C(1))-methyltransferase CbiD [Methanobacteriaceae archaeon]